MGDEEPPGFPRCSRAHKVARGRSPGAWSMVAGEPFRVFFPAGILAGIYGVSLWLMFYRGWLTFAPHLPHARLMVLGFLGAFVLGFLGTALPRMLAAPRLRVVEVIGFLGLYAGAVCAEATGNVVVGDVLFLALFAAFSTAIGWRWIFLRQGHPPAEFLVAVLGLVCAVAGLGIQLAGSSEPLGAYWSRCSSLMIYEGFTLLPIVGIGGFLAPRILDGTGRRSRPVLFGVAMAVIFSLSVEASGWPRVADGIRLAVLSVYFVTQTAVFSKTGARGALPLGLRVAVWSLLASFAFGLVWPELRIGVEHIAFVSGFGLLALTVAARVTLGHSGNSDRFFARNRTMKWIIGLAVLAMATRVSADFFPGIMVSHHKYAALLWIGMGLMWLVWLGRFLWAGDPDDEG